MKTYTVYMHISPSDKRYIGITGQKPENRWRSGKGYKEQYFARAIKKYGWNNFQHIIITKGLSEEEAKWLEIELIRKWDSSNPNNGYNITLGGESGNGYQHTEESKRKQSEKMKGHLGLKGEDNPMYGKNPLDYMTEEAKKERSKKLSISNKGENNPMYGRCGNLNPFYGKQHTEESKRKMRKSVICLTTKKIFYSTKEASEYYNIHNGNIVSCCKGKLKSAGKLSDGTSLKWRYLVWNHSKKYRFKRGDVLCP